jgi:hypothetical protein
MPSAKSRRRDDRHFNVRPLRVDVSAAKFDIRAFGRAAVGAALAIASGFNRSPIVGARAPKSSSWSRVASATRGRERRAKED